MCCCPTLQIKVETRPWTIELPSRKLEVELTVISRCAAAASTCTPLACRTAAGLACSWLFQPSPPSSCITRGVWCGAPQALSINCSIQQHCGAQLLLRPLLVSAVRSNYHVELNPSDVGSQDRYVVQEVIKELAKNRPLDVAGAHTGAAMCSGSSWTRPSSRTLAATEALAPACRRQQAQRC